MNLFESLPFPDAPAAALGGVLGGSVDLDSACLDLGSFSKYFSNPLGGLLHSFLCLRHPGPLRKGNKRTVAFMSCGKCCKYKTHIKLLVLYSWWENGEF